MASFKSNSRRLCALMIIALLTINLLMSTMLINPVQAQTIQVWSDTFVDTSKIESSVDVTQVTDVPGFGIGFTPYSGNPLLSIESCDPWDADGDVLKQVPSAVHPSVLYFPEGMDGYKFWMVFTPFGEVPPGAPPNPGSGGYEDWYWERCTLVRSNDGINWVKTDDYTNPLIAPEDPADWDGDWHCDPDLVYAPGEGPDGESWFLYYCGCSPMAIGVALSHDGKHYTKYAGNPVIPVNTRCPAIVYNATTGIFHGFYNWGSYEIGYATSTDGLNWTPYNPDNPGVWGYVVFRGTPGTFDAYGVTHMDVIYYEGQYWMYYLALPTSSYAGLVIGLATSPDGIHWTQHPEPVLTPGETWTFRDGNTYLVQCLYRPSPVIVDDTMYMYYCGTDRYVAYPGAFNWEVGLAFSTGPDGHVELERYSEPSEYVARPGETIAWYHMNEGPPAPPGEYSPKDQTLAWYHFNEGTETTAGDSSGNNNHGTLDLPTWTTGLYDYGLSFDGNDRVTVPDSATLNPTSAITIEAWVNPSVDKKNNYVLCKMTPAGADYSYGLKLENTYTVSYSEIGAFITDPSGVIYFAYGGSVPTGTWTHIAMTYEMNPTDPTHIKLYKNGVEVTYRYGDPGEATDTIPAGTLIRTNSGPLTIGCLPIATPLYYQGVMDEIRILGRALTAEEIAADAGYSPIVLDSSGNDNHGSPIGGVTWTAGMFSYGLDFDGSTGYVYVPYSLTLNTADEITIEAWIHPDVTKDNNYIISRWLGTYPGGVGSYGFKLNGGTTPGIASWIMHGGTLCESISAFTPPAGEWCFVAMTYDSSEKKIKLYYNGEEVPSYYKQDTVPEDGTIDASTVDLFVGRLLYGTTNYYFDGQMDELRILNRTLTPSEILADYGAMYKSSGSLTSVLITPGSTWDRFYAIDECPAGTSVQYSILNEAGSILIPSVSDGDDISSLGDTPIRLHAELTTSDPLSTPILHEWSVTYVTEVPNTPPVASGLTITPSLPYTTNNLVGIYTYDDADGDSESGTEIRWYKNDVLQPEYNDLLAVSSSSTTPGEVWYFTVRPRDGKDFGTLQTSPSVTIRAFIFSDGFEAGVPGNWDRRFQTSGTITQSSEQAHHESNSAKADVTAAGGYAVVSETLSPLLSTAHMRCYVYFTAFPAATYQTGFLWSSGDTGAAPVYNIVAATVYNDGGTVKWAMVYENAGDYRAVASTPLPQLNTWYCVEIKILVHGTSGEARMYVNGVEILTQTGLDNDAYGNVEYCVAGSSRLPLGTNGVATCYVDCVAVADTYIGAEEELPPPPPPDITPPTYSDVGTNTTVAGQPCLFHARWTDDTGLSGYIFSTNNTGTWVDDAWTPLSGLSDWSNATKTLNPTPGVVVQYQFHCNDTSNNWQSTPIQSLVVTEVVWYPDQVFSVSSNSTVSELIFSSTAREITFTLTGPDGTTGYLDIFISKNLVPNIDDLTIYFDGVEQSYVAISLDNIWYIHLTYEHSTHTLRITLASASPTYTFTELATKLIVGTMIASVASFTLLALFRKKKITK